MEVISIQHGSGGSLTAQLIKKLFYKYFENPYLLEGHDSARLPRPNGRLAFTTDSYVISPLFFPGGNIGKLAVCGTVNDLSMSGAKPLYISSSFIIEAGLSVKVLEEVVAAMADAAKEANVLIVAGDTKVVERGAVDKLFINTAGIGEIADKVEISGGRAAVGDVIISSGTLGDHGMAIMVERQQLQLESQLVSDCAPLNSLVQDMLKVCPDIRVLRDPTRGGAATALNEIATQSQVEIELYEDEMPVKAEVRGVCELLGLDPLYLANEGKLLAVVPEESAEVILAAMKRNPYGRESTVIGKVTKKSSGRVYINTIVGGQRIVDVMVGDPLPRIC
ncbi:hydrogenase expression/formation protein HypE [Dendrosporobacter sp. 1207_IL3150]|uniref:hydrogenase expression/formation protein HypE n=1 Tax=Dendrosporobacter sp. 1207_IL3150 TaxID=3084054 RepID=UPI002FDABFDE